MFTITEWSNFQEVVRKFTPRKGFIQEIKLLWGLIYQLFL